MLFMLLQVLQPELEDQALGDDLPVEANSPALPTSREKVTPTACRVIPALRQYSVWLVSQVAFIVASDGVGPVAIHAKEMWKMYADVLTRLANFYPVESLHSVDYLLEEDETTVGFKPLRDPELPSKCNLYVDDNGALKTHITDQGTTRWPPHEEMQSRVRDIIICALILHQDSKCPIILDLESTVFIFVEKGLAIASPSSPIQFQGPISSFEKSMQTNTDFAIPETDRKNRTVAPDESVAASDSHNSLDISMNRMVDNLVEPSYGRQSASYETSYGMHSRTANEVFAPIGSNGFASHQLQSPPKMLPSLPGLWNSAFTPQPNELQATSPNHSSTNRLMSPMPLSTRQEQLEAAEHLERITGYRRSSKERLENMNSFTRSPREAWGGERAANPNSQAVNESLQKSLAEQFDPTSIMSSDFTNSSSVYVDDTPRHRQPFNGGGMKGQFAPVSNANNSTFYAGGSDFDTAAMLQSSIWNGSQPRHDAAYSQTPPGNQGG